MTAALMNDGCRAADDGVVTLVKVGRGTKDSVFCGARMSYSFQHFFLQGFHANYSESYEEMLLIDKLGRERALPSCFCPSCAIEAGEFGLMDPMAGAIRNLRIWHRRGSACSFVERNSNIH
jgi:hypothetical protein